MGVVVFVAIFLAVALVAYGVLDIAFSEDRRVSKRLQGLSQYEVSQAHAAEPMLAPFGTRVIRPSFERAANFIRGFWPATYQAKLRDRLIRAGNPHGLDVDRLLFGKIACAIGGAGAVAAFGWAGGWAFGWIVLAGIGVAALGFFGPDLWLSNTIEKRQHAIVRALPDMLDMLTISVEAGLGFDAALSKLVRNSVGPLAEEFGRALQEVQGGLSRKDALRNMADRCDVPELSTFTVAIAQADIFGISISHVLRTQSSEMRLRRRQRAEEEAQKAPVKMVVPLVLCILPATIIVIIGPAIVRIGELFS